MTWTTFHHRGEVLRTVIEQSNLRLDGRLPMDVQGVTETFGSETELLAALQLRWYTRLSGRIERQLLSQPWDLEQAVARAYRETVEELPGVRAMLDHYTEHPVDDVMAEALAKGNRTEWTMLAVMAGRAGQDDAAAPRIGREIATRAKTAYRPQRRRAAAPEPTLLDRIKAHLHLAA